MDDAWLHAVQPVNAHRRLLGERETLLKREVEFRILENVLEVVAGQELGHDRQIAARGASAEEQ